MKKLGSARGHSPVIINYPFIVPSIPAAVLRRVLVSSLAIAAPIKPAVASLTGDENGPL